MVNGASGSFKVNCGGDSWISDPELKKRKVEVRTRRQDMHKQLMHGDGMETND